VRELVDTVRSSKRSLDFPRPDKLWSPSLADFAKLVELFDAHGVSFVSVTQQFNTTTSMGRLTLNVLLSFAQFEREVTSERIRDKIAASKRKGIWVGGNLPLGYEMKDGKIAVVEEEAELVRSIFRRYLEVGSVNDLVRDLGERKIRTKSRKLSTGATRGGVPFGRGALYYLLSNHFYIGEVKYKGEILPGEQPPILDRALFEGDRLHYWQHRRARPRGAKEVPRTFNSAVAHHEETTTARISMKNILTIDVGGSQVKFVTNRVRKKREFSSGRRSAEVMVERVKDLTKDWSYDLVSLGYPGPVLRNRPIAEPYNLGCGWAGFDFASAFECPTRVVNDALMQALSNYTGGRMLFLGLGTGLGSAMIVDGVLQPMELGHLPYRRDKTFEDYVGAAGLKRLGMKKWQRKVADVVERLTAALQPEYVVLGGGNAKKMGRLPHRIRLGKDKAAFVGGLRLWGNDNQRSKERRSRALIDEKAIGYR
jgi:polyphosphate glucokinase